MAIQWVDSFDHYGSGGTGATNMLSGPYAELGTSVNPSTGAARTGTTSVRVSFNNANKQFRRAFSSNLTDVIVGMAINLDNLPDANSFEIMAFANSGGTTQFSVTINTVGGIQFWNGNWNTGSVIGEIGPVVTPLGWYYLECKVHHDSSTGSVVFRVNNVEVANLTGLDTGSDSAQFMMTNAGSAIDHVNCAYYIDDIYCCDTTGSVNNDFIGDVRIYTLFPNGDTVSADWTPDTGSTGYTQIDEVPPDGDTSYITADDVDDISEFDMQDLPADVVNVYGVIAVSYDKKDDAGDSGFTLGADSNGSIDEGPEISPTTQYTYHQYVMEEDPDISGAWTRTTVNSAKYYIRKST